MTSKAKSRRDRDDVGVSNGHAAHPLDNDDAPIDPAPETNEIEAPPLPDQAPTGKPGTVLVEVPFCAQSPSAGFCLHIDVRLDVRQSTALRRIAAELDRRGARLANRQRVVHPTHAIKFLLESIGVAFDVTTSGPE